MGLREQTRRGRLPSLTSLRYVAALLVFGYHFRDDVGPSVARWSDVVMRQGFTGVGFFFVLSGFVMAWSAPSGDRPMRFYRRRAARIYPAYLVAWIGAGLVGDRPGLHDLPSLLLLQAWHPDPDVHFGVFAVGWTLSCEAFFYLLFPWMLPRLVALGARRQKTVLAGAVAAPWLIALLADRSDASAWTSTILPAARLPEFVAGVLVALLLSHGALRTPRLAVGAAFASGCYLLASPIGDAYRTALTSTGWVVLVAAVAAADDRTRAVLRRPWMVRLGVLSYAFYLLHGLVIDAWARAGDQTGWWATGELGAVPSVLHLALVVTAATAVSWLLWRVVEHPMERRLRGEPIAP